MQLDAWARHLGVSLDSTRSCQGELPFDLVREVQSNTNLNAQIRTRE